ncbi:hypothetical protein PSACC_00148 [Paramicrosporidium saccamoebae]|uniref:Ankyrin repeat domain-containing protein n=1 Tax=Paramicrosporidium saccamoebae TaxID=1246581 RepID=A0A2H9TQH6_9FUNG|nr:hypothetical protein PSACC_00148 [Paramicrosporidium saccamoebae]
MPTVDELKNQPVEYIQSVYFHDPGRFTAQDLLELCASKKTGIDIHEWLSGALGMDVANLEMAGAAVRTGNIKALDWIIEKNPDAFPSKNSLLDGIRTSFYSTKATELVLWIFAKRPELLPDWERLQSLGSYNISLAMVERVKDYQRRKEWQLQVEQMDQEPLDEITRIG